MAEGVGFEPTKVSLAGFQDRCTRPLCEPSVGKLTGVEQGRKIQREEICHRRYRPNPDPTLGRSYLKTLVYNAAALGGPLLTTAEEEVRLATEVNLYSLLSATKAALPRMVSGRSALLVTGGGFALYPSSDYGVLSVGKAMIRSAALLLAQELKAQGIRVATVTIGGTVAPATAFAPDLIAKKYIEAFENRDGDVETIFTGATA